MNSPGRIAASIGLLVVTGSCDLTAPTERHYNSGARPIVVRPLQLPGVRPDQYLSGQFVILPDLSTITEPILAVALFVDDGLAASGVAPTRELVLDTTRWPDGVHQLTVAIYLQGNSVSLASSLGVPDITYTAPVTFDQTAPTPVVVDSVVWRNNHPTLYWRPNTDRNFRAYIIDHRGNYAEPPTLDRGIDSLVDQSTNSYTDTTITPLYGLSLDYEVAVTNGNVTVSGTPGRIRFGTDTLVATWNPYSHPILNAATNEVYLLDRGPGDTLKAIGPSHTVTRQLAFVSPDFPDAIALSQDQATLYVFSYYFASPRVSALDAATFTVQRIFNLASYGTAAVAGRAGRLYVPVSGYVAVIDAATGAEVGQVPLPVAFPLLAISPDRNTLYVLHRSGLTAVVRRVDVTTDAPVVTTVRTLDDSPYVITELHLSPDGTRLFVTRPLGRHVETLDGTTLATVGHIAPGEILDVAVGGDALYVSHRRDDPRSIYRTAGRVVRYDPSTLTPLEFWDFVDVPEGLAPAPDGAAIYAFGSTAVWIIRR